jgi:hypothetical protein
MISDVRHQNQSCEKGKRLQKVCCRLIHPVREAAQRWGGLVATAGRPAVTILEADQVRSSNEMHKTKNDADD